MISAILGDPGADGGGEGNSKRREAKSKTSHVTTMFTHLQTLLSANQSARTILVMVTQ